MAIKVTSNFDFRLKIKEKIENIQEKFGQALEDIRTELELDATAGKDINGRTFKRYSKKYAEWRKEKGYQSSPPNLTITGTMLSSIRTDVRKDGENVVGRITVNDDPGKVKGNLEKRKFFGLSKEKLAQLKNKIGAT